MPEIGNWSGSLARLPRCGPLRSEAVAYSGFRDISVTNRGHKTDRERKPGWRDIPGIRKCHSNRWWRFQEREENAHNMGRGAAAKKGQCILTKAAVETWWYYADAVMRLVLTAIGQSSRERDSKLPSMEIRGLGFENAAWLKIAANGNKR